MPTHAEKRVLPYQPDQIYDLVADVMRYPEFLPWTAAARIKSRKELADGRTELMADLVISFKGFRERFTSRAVLDTKARRIDTSYLDGPFKHMNSFWHISEHPEGCEVEFFVDFEFRNAVLQKLIGVVFNQAMQRIVRAFEERAAELYGARK
ncbi:MAG: type II toxin-antitoxin system RatA family toxin [Rhodobacteraceae bacterium]|nr:type II toxin-antitoxin system RatA family toxin [Paracoccaceae bacterium]